jgi:Beta-lactamase enzyme family
MIEFSDNDAATSLWNDVGGAVGVAAFNRLIGMPNTVPGPGGFWGLTTTTSLDQVQLMQAVAYPNAVLSATSRGYIESLMENVTPSQRWGVSGGVPAGVTIALKNGWLPNGAGWEINSIGHVVGQGHDYVIAVMTSDDPSMGYGISTVEGVSSLVWPGLPSGPVLGAQSVTSSSDGAENVFWRAADGQLVHDYFTGSGPWEGPQPLGGSLASGTAAIATPGSGLDVFYVGSGRGSFTVTSRARPGWRTVPYRGRAWRVA